MIRCPYCQSEGWCMRWHRGQWVRALQRHKSRLRLQRKVLALARQGLAS